MKPVFADSLYWIAITYVRDQWHQQAIKASQRIQRAEIVTTEEVLTEFLAAFRYDPALRQPPPPPSNAWGTTPRSPSLNNPTSLSWTGSSFTRTAPTRNTDSPTALLLKSAKQELRFRQ